MVGGSDRLQAPRLLVRRSRRRRVTLSGHGYQLSQPAACHRRSLRSPRSATCWLRFLHTPATTGGSLTTFEMLLLPGGRMPVPHHHRDGEETIYGLTGTGTWTVSGGVIEVGPGETLHIPRGIVHGFKNATREPTTCLCVLTPGVLTPAYFHEMAALAEVGEPDPAAMRETMLRHGLVPQL